MKSTFFPRLAASNLKKNAKTYVPFILSCILTTAMFYLIKSLSQNPGINDMTGGTTIAYTMYLGSWIVGLFALIFLFYTNSFLIKRRKKEFGVFHILGMEKRHLAIVLGWETLYAALLSAASGLGIGIALDKAMFLMLGRLMQAGVVLGFFISLKAIRGTVFLFAFIFALIYLNTVRQIRFANPVELLQGSNVGEREPKTKRLLALLGLFCVAAGYYIAAVTHNPISSIYNFFIAVLLVIVGTYLLFTAGSIAFLKLLRANRAYYYKTKHFTSIAGMIYRMKQNAVGLANICILSTMVLVTVSATVSMVMGVEDIVSTRYPNSFTVVSTNPAQEQKAFATVRKLQKERGLHVTDEEEFSCLSLMLFREDDGMTFTDKGGAGEIWMDGGWILVFVPLSDYNASMGESRTLQKDEILVYPLRGTYDEPKLRLYDKEYRVAKNGKLDAFMEVGYITAVSVNSLMVVLPDMEQMQDIYEQQAQNLSLHSLSGIRRLYGFDTDAGTKEQKAFAEGLKQHLAEQGFSVSVEARETQRMDFISLYSSFFFIGVFLAVLFVMATVLIIYYKQISEGYDDKERFAIMQNVGMSLLEVRASIRSQVLSVFFLPLVVAACHVVAAFPLLTELLALLNFTNTKLYVMTTIASFAAFAGMYVLIYTLTAKTYYKIVSR